MVKRGWMCCLLLAVGCSAEGDRAAVTSLTIPAGETTTSVAQQSTTTTESLPPAGPSADITTEIVGGNGPFVASSRPTDLVAAGYVEREYFAAGTAVSYVMVGEPTSDGRWSFEPGSEAAYRTRIVVRMPSDIDEFSGTVIVEWFNISGGVDGDPEWTAMQEEIIRQGDAWVGVSTQMVGVSGGPVVVPVDAPGAEVAGSGLVGIDPTRYASLQHPGDGFSFDIYTQVARALRSGAATAGAQPQRLIAAGQSQSAFALVTYYNGVQPLTEAFDGFLIHSRGAGWLPLAAAGAPAGIGDALGAAPTTLRTDLAAPVLVLQSETDVTGIFDSVRARQADDKHIRLWEVAGTAHYDEYRLGDAEGAIDCGGRINSGPMHLVAKAALRALTTWVATGDVPPVAPRLEVTSEAAPQIVRDADGIAIGGIRTPPVDVPVAVLSGAPVSTESVICLLLGATVPLTAERIGRLYQSPADYQERFEAAVDESVTAGYVLVEDRVALLAFAEPDAIAG